MAQLEYTVADLRAGRIPGLTKHGRARQMPAHTRVCADVIHGHGWVRIVAPIEAVSEANRHDLRHAQARRTKGQRRDMAAMLLLAGPCVVAGPWKVTLVRIGPKPLDTDNLAGSCKAVRDQLAKWLGVDDGTTAPVTWAYEQRRGGVREYGVEIVVETAERKGG